jgi:hypothetical protein
MSGFQMLLLAAVVLAQIVILRRSCVALSCSLVIPETDLKSRVDSRDPLERAQTGRHSVGSSYIPLL